jgi:hypothetical protein
MISSSIKCHFCNGPHHCKDCKIEKTLAPHVRKIIGRKMEFFIGEHLSCPYCNKKELSVLDDNSPSLDVMCNNCGKCYEIKSKCLSCERLPEKLYLTHGNYDYYLDRQEEVLDFFILIYKVNRQTKEIIIRKVFHVSDNDIRNYNNFIIKPDDDNYHCNIIINNHNLFQENKKVKNYKISMVNEINTLFKDIYSN